jgi:hypothetical protein
VFAYHGKNHDLNIPVDVDRFVFFACPYEHLTSSLSPRDASSSSYKSLNRLASRANWRRACSSMLNKSLKDLAG